MLGPKRHSTPADVKRRLRQEAGFGCCFCGYPFIQYHHLIPFAEDHHFRPEDMMAICPNHHSACTVGAITMGEQRAAKARPKNMVDGMMRGVLHVTSSKLAVELGGGIAVETPHLLMFREQPIVSAVRSPDGRVLVSATILTPEGVPAATLDKNEWSVLPDRLWDFEIRERWAAARHGPGRLAFAVDCRNDKVRISGEWSLGGLPVFFNEREVRVGYHRFETFHVENYNCFIGID